MKSKYQLLFVGFVPICIFTSIYRGGVSVCGAVDTVHKESVIKSKLVFQGRITPPVSRRRDDKIEGQWTGVRYCHAYAGLSQRMARSAAKGPFSTPRWGRGNIPNGPC